MSALYQSEDKPLLQVNADLWINPRAVLFAQRPIRLSDEKQGIELSLNGTMIEITEDEWAAIKPCIVAIPVPASENVTPNPVIAQVINELLVDTVSEECISQMIKGLNFWEIIYPCDTEDQLRERLKIGTEPAIAQRLLEEAVAPKSLMVQAVEEALAEDEGLPTQTPEEPETDLARLVKVIKSGDFVILDTETTGLKADAEICQISIIDSAGNTLLDTLVKPQKSIPADAQRIHGISNDDVKNAPSWLNVNEKVWALLQGKTVIVYNAVYDFRLLAQSEAACVPFGLSDWATIKRECAMLAYGEYRGIWDEYHGNWKWHKLSDAAARVGYTLPEGMKAHAALADCLMTLAVCKKLAGL